MRELRDPLLMALDEFCQPQPKSARRGHVDSSAFSTFYGLDSTIGSSKDPSWSAISSGNFQMRSKRQGLLRGDPKERRTSGASRYMASISTLTSGCYGDMRTCLPMLESTR